MSERVDKLYDYITEHISCQEALKNMLEGTLNHYEKLKANEGDPIHPTVIMAIAAMEMGWDIALKKGENGDDTEVEGMIIGNEKYISETLKL